MALGVVMQEKGAGTHTSEASSSPSSARELAAGMRHLLLIAGVLVFLAGVQLFVFTERTEEFFSWTIDPSATAAFLGAGYWAAVAVEWLAAGEKTWDRARVAVPAVFVFTTLTLVATLLHLEIFHFDSPGLGTRAVTWIWLAIYALVPVVMGALWWRQSRSVSEDPSRTAPLATWVRAVLGLYGVGLLVLGILMFLLPVETATALWPWTLEPLSSRAVAAWLIPMGVLAVHALIENDWVRLRPAAGGLVLLGSFQLFAVMRYRFEFEWGDGRSWVYLAALVGLLALGLYGWLKVDAARRSASTGA